MGSDIPALDKRGRNGGALGRHFFFRGRSFFWKVAPRMASVFFSIAAPFGSLSQGPDIPSLPKEGGPQNDAGDISSFLLVVVSAKWLPKLCLQLIKHGALGKLVPGRCPFEKVKGADALRFRCARSSCITRFSAPKKAEQSACGRSLKGGKGLSFVLYKGSLGEADFEGKPWLRNRNAHFSGRVISLASSARERASFSMGSAASTSTFSRGSACSSEIIRLE